MDPVITANFEEWQVSRLANTHFPLAESFLMETTKFLTWKPPIKSLTSTSNHWPPSDDVTVKVLPTAWAISGVTILFHVTWSSSHSTDWLKIDNDMVPSTLTTNNRRVALRIGTTLLVTANKPRSNSIRTLPVVESSVRESSEPWFSSVQGDKSSEMLAQSTRANPCNYVKQPKWLAWKDSPINIGIFTRIHNT